MECESSLYEKGANYIKCLVLNTGFNTYHGSFLQNILFPKRMNFKFYRELKIFTNVMILLYFITISIMSYSFIRTLNLNMNNNINSNQKTFIDQANLQGSSHRFNITEINADVSVGNISGYNISTIETATSFYDILNNTDPKKLWEFLAKIIDLLSVIIPPSLHICMSVTSIYFNYTLKSKNITCISEKRLNAAGKVNIIVLDKTGTLTSDCLEITGFQTTQIKKDEFDIISESYYFDKIQKSLKLYNSIHREFWMRFSNDSNNSFYKDYKTNPRNNPVYFIECLATCLSIDKLKNNILLGNTIDKSIFQIINWEINKIEEKWNDYEVNH